MDTLFDQWLERTRELQRVWYDTDPQSLEGEARAEYVRWNVLAADHELHEFLDHIQWKPWSSRLGELRDRDDAVEELVDVLHFIANLLLVLGVDGDELNAVYLAKMAKNSARQEAGYDSFGKAEGKGDVVMCTAPRCELAKHDASTAHRTDGIQWTYTADLGLAERRAEEAAGRESVRHPATRTGPGGVRQQWNVQDQRWTPMHGVGSRGST